MGGTFDKPNHSMSWEAFNKMTGPNQVRVRHWFKQTYPEKHARRQHSDL